MKKIILFITVMVFLIIISMPFLNSPNQLFKTHVLPQKPKTIENLKYYKDRCGMHGPFIFAFKASRQDIQKIIQNNNLTKYEKIPEFANTLLAHIDSHNLSWWKKSEDFNLMDIYGRENHNDNEPHLKFIFIDKEIFVYYLQI